MANTTKIIKTVYGNERQKLVTIPKDCNINIGDKVAIEKISKPVVNETSTDKEKEVATEISKGEEK